MKMRGLVVGVVGICISLMGVSAHAGSVGILRSPPGADHEKIKQHAEKRGLRFLIQKRFGAEAFLIEGELLDNDLKEKDASEGFYIEWAEGEPAHPLISTGQLILHFANGISIADQKRIIDNLGFIYSHPIYGTTDTAVVNYPPTMKAQQAHDLAIGAESVLLVDINYLMTTTGSPPSRGGFEDPHVNLLFQQMIFRLMEEFGTLEEGTLQVPIDLLMAQLLDFGDQSALHPILIFHRILSHSRIREELSEYFLKLENEGRYSPLNVEDLERLDTLLQRMLAIHFVPADYRPRDTDLSIMGEEVANYVEEIGGDSLLLTSQSELAGAPNDPLFGLQWDKMRMDAENAWDLVYGSVSQRIKTAVSIPKIAILDSAIDLGHEDFGGKITMTRSFIDPLNPNQWLDASDVCPLAPGMFARHGTAVAGIAAAIGNNGIGIAGMAWNAQIHEFVVCLDEFFLGLLPSCPPDAIAGAIRFAVDHGSDVINMSFSGPVVTNAVALAVEYADDNDVLVVAAVGNSGGTVEFPANLSPIFDNVIAVGGTDSNDQIWDCGRPNVTGCSSLGPELTVWAPTSFDANNLNINVGVPTADVVDPALNNQCGYSLGSYTGFGGTSGAAPQVAGLAALMLSLAPNMDPWQIKAHLNATAVGTYPYGSGRVDAFGAVQRVLNQESTPAGAAISVYSSAGLNDVSVYLAGTAIRYIRVDNFGTGPFEIRPVSNVPWLTSDYESYIVAPGQLIMIGLQYNADQIANCADTGTIQLRYQSASGAALASYSTDVYIYRCTDPVTDPGSAGSCSQISVTSHPISPSAWLKAALWLLGLGFLSHLRRSNRVQSHRN